jgi:hypothetical protein
MHKAEGGGMSKPKKMMDYLNSLPKDKPIRIYLNNHICIYSEPEHITFFDDYLFMTANLR